MQIIKLGLISVVMFYLLIWAMSLVLPKVNIMSRAINIAGSKDSISAKLGDGRISYGNWLTNNNPQVELQTGSKSFYKNNLFNAERQENADTIYFEMRHQQQAFLRGGLGLYQLSEDSATAQLFYVFHTSWYKPWEKMAQMLNDAKYGGQMEEALGKLKLEAEKPAR